MTIKWGFQLQLRLTSEILIEGQKKMNCGDNFSVQAQQDGAGIHLLYCLCAVVCSILLPSERFAYGWQVELAFSPFPRWFSAMKNKETTGSEMLFCGGIQSADPREILQSEC